MNILGRESNSSSVRFLESCSGTTSTELLWLASSIIWNKKILVILNEEFLKFSLCGFISVFLVVSKKTFSNCHSDCHNLNHWTSTLNSNSDWEILESVSTYNEDWLEDFSSHWFWLDKMKRLSIYSNNSLSFLNKGDCCSILFFSKSSNLFLFFTHYFFDLLYAQTFIVLKT